MRALIISDIHANLTALETVLKDAEKVNDGKIEAVWCLGDLVGYGPDPNECVERIANLPNLQCIIGNHDAAAIGSIEVDAFNPEARKTVLWTQERLTSLNKDYLRSLPERVSLEFITLVHGSPFRPIWEYLLDTRTATISFEFFESPYCFVGHTHLPVVYYLPDDRTTAQLIVPEHISQMTLAPRSILNPGSVGQPRDRDPRAAYAILNLADFTWEWHRVDYDIHAVQERMRKENLPERHISRLSAGW
jgi:diadenosine tetraphosphatase ApaH/serine/threonine PP2A family protein phosphatase